MFSIFGILKSELLLSKFFFVDQRNFSDQPDLRR